MTILVASSENLGAQPGVPVRRNLHAASLQQDANRGIAAPRWGNACSVIWFRIIQV